MKKRSMRDVIKRSTLGLGAAALLGLMAASVCPNVSLAADPAGVTNAVLWLDAAQLIGLNNGDRVSSWTDMSGNNNNASANWQVATYQTNAINGQPVVRYHADGNANFSFTRISTIRTVFWVVKNSNPGLHFLLGDNATCDFHSGDSTIWASYASASVVGGTTKVNGTVVNGTATALPSSSFSLVSLVTAGNVQANQLSLDRNLGGRSWAGDIAEVVIYDRPLTAVEERKVSDYLAAKYGLAVESSRLHYTWLNPPASATWNTTDANWEGDGSVWVNNLNSNKAFFGASTQKAVTIASVQVQEMNVTADGYSFSGGTLDVKDTFMVNAGCTATVNSAVSVGIGNYAAVVSSGTLRIGGGTFVLTNSAISAHMVIGGANSALIVTNGFCDLSRSPDLINSGSHVTVDGSGVLDVWVMRPAQEYSWINTSINMNGGTLQANGFGVDLGGYRVGEMNFNGGTLKAKQDTIYFMGGSIWRNSDGSGVKCYVRAGGAIIDSNGKNITIVQPFLSGAASDGGLIKKGLGTLTLSGTNTYVGATAVSNGVLAVTGTYVLPTTTDLYLSTASGAKLQLAFEGTITVRRFYINGELQERVKVYSAINRPLVLSGTGFLVVTEGTSGGTLLRLF